MIKDHNVNGIFIEKHVIHFSIFIVIPSCLFVSEENNKTNELYFHILSHANLFVYNIYNFFNNELSSNSFLAMYTKVSES